MKYRITIDIETEGNRQAINKLAMDMKEVAEKANWVKPLYVSTERLTPDVNNIYGIKS